MSPGQVGELVGREVYIRAVVRRICTSVVSGKTTVQLQPVDSDHRALDVPGGIASWYLHAQPEAIERSSYRGQISIIPIFNGGKCINALDCKRAAAGPLLFGEI